MNRTPVCLVTGFLGSGKTTFLKGLAKRYRDRRLVYLINELCTTNVDHRRLGLPGDCSISITGGSLFCRSLVTEFIEMLRAARTFFAGEVEGVIVEVGGIADPRVFGRMLQETQLDRVYRQALHVTLVDPATSGNLFQTLPNIRTQVEAADVVLINKSDLHARARLVEIEANVRRLNAKARLLRTRHGQSKIDIFASSRADPAKGSYASFRDPRFSTCPAHIPAPVNWEKLLEAIEQMRDLLYRVKGFVACSDGWRYVDWAAGVWSVEKTQADKTSELVLIGEGEADERLRRLQQRIEAGTYTA